jgi:hypothetical protein
VFSERWMDVAAGTNRFLVQSSLVRNKALVLELDASNEAAAIAIK